MSISSTFAFDGPVQKDGRRFVRETHIDNLGIIHVVEYLAATGTDYQAVLTARSPQIEEQLESAEALNALVFDAAPSLNYQTLAQFLQRLRTLYKAASQDECGRIATWIINRLNAGNVTASQLQNVFNLTPAQWTTLQTKMTNLRTNYLVVQSAIGE